MLIFIDLSDIISENNSFNPRPNFVLHSVIAQRLETFQEFLKQRLKFSKRNHLETFSIPPFCSNCGAGLYGELILTELFNAYLTTVCLF